MLLSSEAEGTDQSTDEDRDPPRAAPSARALIKQWRRARRRSPAEELRFLHSPQGAAAFATDPAARKEQIRQLRKRQDQLLLQACSEPWFRAVWHHGTLYAPRVPCACDYCPLRRLWPTNHYVGSTGLSFECATEGRLRKWYLMPASPSASAIEAMGRLTAVDQHTGQTHQGGKLLSPIRMLPESEAALKQEIARYLQTGKVAKDRRRVNIERIQKGKK